MSGDRDRFDVAVDWLLNSRHCADPDIQEPFWAFVDGHITLAELRDESVLTSEIRARIEAPTPCCPLAATTREADHSPGCRTWDDQCDADWENRMDLGAGREWERGGEQ